MLLVNMRTNFFLQLIEIFSSIEQTPLSTLATLKLFVHSSRSQSERRVVSEISIRCIIYDLISQRCVDGCELVRHA